MTPSPPSIEVHNLTKRFGTLPALDEVSLTLEPGTFHALLGENGAGKSTLAKCIMGHYRADPGSISVDGKADLISTPRHAHELGIGMVYQHFTLVPSMSVIENLILAKHPIPAVVDWKKERTHLQRFLSETPLTFDLDRTVSSLSAGEKQKVEILKLLFLQRRVLILDEPTSVLTPDEALDVLSLIGSLAERGEISVLLITHKLAEVTRFARKVTVLRRGRKVGEGPVAAFTADMLADLMVGTRQARLAKTRTASATQSARLELRGISANNDRGQEAVRSVAIKVGASEILGIAGVAGNGQRELVEVIAGQRLRRRGTVLVDGRPYGNRRQEIVASGLSLLPEEPLRSACVPQMSVVDNLMLRRFDRPPQSYGGLLRRRAMREAARTLVNDFGIKAASLQAPLMTLSGGNVQRLVLARELSEQISVLVAHNPCFGLDVAAIAEIHNRILAARNAGAAVLLISEDLDELLTLSDRLMVMFKGRIVHETSIVGVELGIVGQFMAGHFEGMDELTETL